MFLQSCVMIFEKIIKSLQMDELLSTELSDIILRL